MMSHGLASVSIVVAIVCPSTRARADAAEVEALIAKGNELRRAGTPGPALPYFQKAYELARTPRTNGQLGLAELDAGYPVEAADHLAAALQSPNDPTILKYRKVLSDALTKARSQIGELVLDGSPGGAEVLIDGHAVGVLPLPSPVRIAAHSAEVIVRAPGYQQHRELLPIAGGQRHPLTVSLEKTEKPAEASAATATGAGSPSISFAGSAVSARVIVDRRGGSDIDSGLSHPGLRSAAWVIGGGAAVAAGLGFALNLAARSNRAEFDGSCVNMNGIHMAAPLLTESECQDRYAAWQSDRRWSIAGYVAGGALAVTSGVLFWASRRTSPSASLQAHIACAPTPDGFTCRGGF